MITAPASRKPSCALCPLPVECSAWCSGQATVVGGRRRGISSRELERLCANWEPLIEAGFFVRSFPPVLYSDALQDPLQVCRSYFIRPSQPSPLVRPTQATHQPSLLSPLPLRAPAPARFQAPAPRLNAPSPPVRPVSGALWTRPTVTPQPMHITTWLAIPPSILH